MRRSQKKHALRVLCSFVLVGSFVFPRESKAASDRASESVVLSPLQISAPRPVKYFPIHPSEFVGESIDPSRTGESSLSRAVRRSTALVTRESGGEGQAPTFLIRGQDPIQNRFFIGDVPLTDAEFNVTDVSTLPIESISRIDVYAEGVPAFLAEDGLGGAIRFELGSWENGKRGEELKIRGGSYGYRYLSGRARENLGVPVELTLGYTQSDEDFYFYDDNGTPFNPEDDFKGRRNHNRFLRGVLLPRALLLNFQNHSVDAFSLNSFSGAQIPGPLQIPTRASLRRFLQVSGIHHAGSFGEAWHSDDTIYWRLGQDSLENESLALSPGLASSDASALAGGFKSRWQWTGKSQNEIQFSVGSSLETYRVGLNEKSDEHSRVQIPLSFSAQVPVLGQALVLKPAIVGHYFSYFGNAQSAFAPLQFFLLSPRFGVTSRLSRNLQLRSTLGHYYRAPSMRELFGAPAGISASRNLKYESAEKAEVGFDWELRRPAAFLEAFQVSYTFSWSTARDLVDYFQNSQETKVAINIGKSRMRSHEIAIEAQSRGGLSARLGATFLEAENLTEVPSQIGKQLPNRPQQRFIAGVNYERSQFEAGYWLTLSGPTYWDLNNAKRLSGIAEHSLRASWKARDWGIWGVELLNLFDQTTAESTFSSIATTDNTTGYFGYPAPGRRAYLSWRYQL